MENLMKILLGISSLKKLITGRWSGNPILLVFNVYEIYLGHHDLIQKIRAASDICQEGHFFEKKRAPNISLTPIQSDFALR